MKKTPILLFIILIIIAITYSYTLINQFVWDDTTFILSWSEIRSTTFIPDLIKGAAPIGHEGVYRPIRSLFYFLFINLYGQNSFLYHATSIILHLSIVYLVYLITKKLTSDKSVSLITAFVFGLHPLHSESVAFITASFDLFGVLFFFGSYLLYIHYRMVNKKVFYLTSICLGFLAFFSYELTFTLPIIILLTELLMFAKNSSFKKIILLQIPFVACITLNLITRSLLNISSRGILLENSYFTAIVFFKSFAIITLKALIPFNLSAIPSVDGVITSLDLPKEAIIAQSITDPTALIGITFFITILILAVLSFKKVKFASFGYLFFLLTLIPGLLTFFTGNLISERYAYLSLFGFSLLVGLLINKLSNLNMKLFYILIAAITLNYCGQTLLRTMDWNNDLTLWKDTVKKSPQSATAHLYLGLTFLAQKQLISATDSFRKTIEIYPQYSEAYSGLGTVYKNQNDLTQAAVYFEKALYYNSEDPVAYFNLAEIKVQLKKIDEAEIILQKGTQKFPNHPWLNYNLAIIYTIKGDDTKALKTLQKILETNPGFTPALEGLKRME